MLVQSEGHFNKDDKMRQVLLHLKPWSNSHHFTSEEKRGKPKNHYFIALVVIVPLLDFYELEIKHGRIWMHIASHKYFRKFTKDQY